MAAVPRWRPSLGAFSTYAAYWIRQHISRALADTGATVRLPVHFRERRAQLARIRRQLEHQHGRSVSEAEVEAELPPTRRLWPLHHLLTDAVSLSTPRRGLDDDDSGDLTMGTGMEDDTVASPEDTSLTLGAARRVRGALARLTPRQARVIELRYGLGTDDEPMSLEAVAALFGLTRQRVQQMETQSLGRLRRALTRAPRVGAVAARNGHRPVAPPAEPPAPTNGVVRLRTRRGTVVRSVSS
jgi:RNA polymerase primary sigma factor